MKKGLLIYRRSDYEINRFFADALIEEGAKRGLTLKLVFREDMILGLTDGRLSACWQDGNARDYTFAVNRSRDALLARQLEGMGLRLFNRAAITEMANDKIHTHQQVNALGIPSADSLFLEQGQRYDRREYPVVKSVDGHGGNEVYCLSAGESLPESLAERARLLAQKRISAAGDVRVYVLGGNILAAVKRTSEGFRSNFSLGGQAEAHALTPAQRETVLRITESFSPDFVGLDFLIDEEGRFLFNEMEDAVGCRMLYHLSLTDPAADFMTCIADCL